MLKEIRSIVHNPELIPMFSCHTIEGAISDYERDYKEMHTFGDLNDKEKRLLRLIVHSNMLKAYLTQINESYSIFKERLLILLIMASIQAFLFKEMPFSSAVIYALPSTFVVGCTVIVSKSIDYIKAFRIVEESIIESFLVFIVKHKPKEKDALEHQKAYDDVIQEEIEDLKCWVRVAENRFNARLKKAKPHSWIEATVYCISYAMALTGFLGCKKPTGAEKKQWEKELDDFAPLEKGDIIIKEYTTKTDHVDTLILEREKSKSRERLLPSVNKSPHGNFVGSLRTSLPDSPGL